MQKKPFVVITYANDTDNLTEHDTSSDAIAWLCKEIDAGDRDLFGIVNDDAGTIVSVRSKPGSIKVKVYDPSSFNGLELKSTTPVEIEQVVRKR